MEDSVMEKKHFVLVHGTGHGAWCWYKLSTLLRSAGHRVTAMDLAASGIDPRKLEEVSTFAEYSQPLMDIMSSLPSEEKVILVGHSFGGMNIAFAMERFPEKVAVAVFLSAFMPDSTSGPSYVLEKFVQSVPITAMDNRVSFNQGPGSFPTSVLFGPQYLSAMLYQRCPAEDITLAISLVRVAYPLQKIYRVHWHFQRIDMALYVVYMLFVPKILQLHLNSSVGWLRII